MSLEILNEKNRLQNRINEIRKELSDKAENFLAELFVPIFQKYTSLKSISWKAYSPFFNDGDSCPYSSYHGDPSLNGYNPDYGDDECSEEDWEEPEFPDFVKRNGDYVYEAQNDKQKLWGEIENEVKNILGQFDDDDMLTFFGDHVEVTITENGVSVDEYTSHD